MSDPFIVRALAAALMIAIVAAPLGCLVVWRRMSYFGDSLAHSSLLGIALGLFYGLPLHFSILISGTLFAVLLITMQHRHILANDTILGILAHASLSIGLVSISLINRANFNLESLLFGDILTVGTADLYWIGGVAIFTLALLWRFWQPLVLMTLHSELAKAEGHHVFRLNILMMALMTLVVSAAIQIVGIILITSMLIIPAATARQLSNSPSSMAFVAMITASLSAFLGLGASILYDIPSGPAIVTSAATLFFLSLCKPQA